jgi:cytochrome c1
MLPSDYKRKYKFKTDTSKERKYMNIAIIVSLIMMIILWYLIN